MGQREICAGFEAVIEENPSYPLMVVCSSVGF